MTEEVSFEETLRVAERVVEVLARRHVDAVVIGAMALAVHHYPRDTQDFDLAVAMPPSDLEALAATFRGLGWEVEVRTPDASDPLGGVLDINAPGADLVQVINFDNPPSGGFPGLVRAAAEKAQPLAAGSPVKVADLPALIAFKLYAGGSKSKLDILELLDRNQPVDIEELGTRCAALGLRKKLERLLAFRQEE